MDASKFGAWLAAYPRDTVLAQAREVVAAAKQEFGAESAAALGFCWGGLYAALLAGGPSPDVAAAVLAHPSLLTQADVDGLRAPTLFLVNGDDAQVPDAFRAAIAGALEGKPGSEMVYYPDARHGARGRGGGGGGGRGGFDPSGRQRPALSLPPQATRCAPTPRPTRRTRSLARWRGSRGIGEGGRGPVGRRVITEARKEGLSLSPTLRVGAAPRPPRPAPHPGPRPPRRGRAGGPTARPMRARAWPAASLPLLLLLTAVARATTNGPPSLLLPLDRRGGAARALGAGGVELPLAGSVRDSG